MAAGSKRTQVPTLKDGIRPAAASFRIVTCETERSFASSFAVSARPIFSICSARHMPAHESFLHRAVADRARRHSTSDA